MSRVLLVASNLATAALTVVVTSMYWIGSYGGETGGRATSGEARSRAVREQAGTTSPVSLPRGDEPLRIGPTGIAIPVIGITPSQLSDTFTQARDGGLRVHDAIDIMAPAGTPVVAAAPGVVEKLFFSQGGGITAYVRSTDGRWSYYYAHLLGYAPGIREGQALRQGDRIGDVGSTGNASPDGPHLHFAIHRMEKGERWHQGKAINPYPLLAGDRAPR